MPDTIRLLAELQTLLATNTNREISAKDVRDFLMSAVPSGRVVSQVVAASNASILRQAQADIVCNGTADDVDIQTAVDA